MDFVIHNKKNTLYDYKVVYNHFRVPKKSDATQNPKSQNSAFKDFETLNPECSNSPND